ncbi:hypothetical protein BDY17DRAFT_325831 [Neohortaea acidophila]|uniref:F-box domain-containing protein n=1 Tax=Neohortaea acidophila TaxID=245834 RepID=A0A6A6PNU9_9PEZI|nr:uncharacterized protein BDY17DRAFT_325831 [Neohortaea acidophila]KAF2481113.1 hypothetical protein BDY17DRAFT_325831 [Neohortaea acidophila]
MAETMPVHGQDKPAQQHPRGLLGLPAELLLYICDLTFGQREPIHLFRTLTPSINQADVKQPCLSRACRQLRAFVLPRFYNTTVFIVNESYAMPTHLVLWLRAIGQHNRVHLMQMYVRGSWNASVLLVLAVNVHLGYNLGRGGNLSAGMDGDLHHLSFPERTTWQAEVKKLLQRMGIVREVEDDDGSLDLNLALALMQKTEDDWAVGWVEEEGEW